MGKVRGFLDFPRQISGNIPAEERVKNYKEFILHLSDEEAKVQGRPLYGLRNSILQ